MSARPKRWVALLPHPATPSQASLALTVDIARRAGGRLAVEYRVVGDTFGLRVPPRTDGRRRDGLWHHTCFEAFVRRPGATAYHEINLSPSTDWAVYGFADYRELTEVLADRRLVRFDTGPSPRGLRVAAQVDLSLLDDGYVDAPIDVALSAVLEERGDRLSYWSLHHASGMPDFHHATSFALHLEAVEATAHP